MFKIKEYPDHIRQRLELAIRKAQCVYCHIPFFLTVEREKALVSHVDDRVFFIHEECFNARYN